MSRPNRIVIGPSISPTPESEDDENAQRSRHVIGPSMSPTPESEDIEAAHITITAAALPIDNDLPSPDERSSKKKRKKKKHKRRKSLDSDTLVEDAASAGIDEAGTHESTKRGSREKRKKKKSRKDHPDPEEDAAMTDGSHPESPIKSVEESPSSPKRKKKRSKKNPTHDDELPLGDGTQEEGLVKGDVTHAEADPAQNDVLPGNAPDVLHSPKSARKKRNRSRKADDAGGARTSDAQQVLVSHALGGSPPSAQPPRLNDILKYEPLMENNEDDASVVPDSQWQPPQDLRFHFTGIAANFADAVTDPVAEAKRENDPQSGLGWLHKRENAPQDTPVTTARGTLLDTALPDLQPSQVKTEPESGIDINDSTESEPSSSSDESNSQSPSVQRLERLSRSRSRSASRAPSRSGYLADQTLGLVATARPDPYERVPYSAPSSTGSNRSIPARLPSPSSTGSNRSIPAVIQPRPSPSHSRSSRSSVSRRSGRASRDDAPADADAMDIDQLSAQEPSSPKTKKATLGKKKKGRQVAQLDKGEAGIRGADVEDQIGGSQSAKSKTRNPKGDSNENLADMSVRLMANGVSQQPDAEAPGQDSIADDELPLDSMPAATEVISGPPTSQLSRSKKRQPKASLISDHEAPDPAVASEEATKVPESTVENGGPPTSPKKEAKKRAPRATVPIDISEVEVEAENEGQIVGRESAVAGNATATRNDSIEPGESASQPQTKSKPKGKRKRILNQPKVSLSLSQMEGDEEDEDFSTIFARRRSGPQPTAGGSNEPEQSQVGGLQAPSPEKPRKPKRKRRTGASEDEMDSLLAAGPSRGRKSRNLDLSDDDREAKRKRLSATGKGKATGAWTQDELNALGKVVEDFMEEHSLPQDELNKLVQAVPNKAESTNKDFWDRAEQAIPQRTRKQITERARRIYHNFVARGTWTQEQKDEVHDLFETHPKKWKEIAAMINRDPKDVRDYWRNSYLVLESQIKSRWSKEEEERLREVMEEALSKIRIIRENNDQPLRNSRGKGADDEAMIDWQQISAAMDLTRSRQQCKWKWVDMREKGLVGDDSLPLPTQPRGSGPRGNKVNGISEELANAREDYRGMGPEETYRLIDAIKDSGAREDKLIPWRTLVDERFRTKWHRPVLRLTWYRLRQTVPGYEDQDVEANARFLVNYYHMHQMFPRFDDNAIDEQMEETVVHYKRGKRVWKRPSSDLRAVRERQRRSSSASSRASSRLSRKVSSEILNLSGDEDGPSGSRQSAELGEERGRPRATQDRAGLKGDNVSVNIPDHLQGESAKKALTQARAQAKAKKARKKEVADGESRRVRSNSVALDSDSE
ncbi:RNA polymerase I enhancer binding protein [Gnomoniopsis sp. IMI 355080]|nr:RNA polymerase I enhancer binding protein [Gnomoniopsis sp. IMI 355080]